MEGSVSHTGRFCRNRACVHYGLEGKGNIVKFGRFLTTGEARRQRFRCRTCGRTFSERTGSVFCGLHRDTEVVLDAILELAAGYSVRQVAEFYRVTPKTICLWVKRARQCPDEVVELSETESDSEST